MKVWDCKIMPILLTDPAGPLAPYFWPAHTCNHLFLSFGDCWLTCSLQLAKFAHPFEGDYCDYRSFSGRTLILNELQVCHGVCAHHIHRPCKNLKKWLTHHPQNGVVLFVRGQSFIRFIQQCRHNRAMKPIAFGSLRAPPGAHESER